MSLAVLAAASWQYVVLALIVLASVIKVLRKLAPHLSTRIQARVATALSRRGRPGAVRHFGIWLRPRQATGSCGDGCGTCGSCGPAAAPAPDDARPVVFHERK